MFIVKPFIQNWKGDLFLLVLYVYVLLLFINTLLHWSRIEIDVGCAKEIRGSNLVKKNIMRGRGIAMCDSNGSITLA